MEWGGGDGGEGGVRMRRMVWVKVDKTHFFNFLRYGKAYKILCIDALQSQ